MAHVSRLTSVVFAVDRAFPLVIATATATSWMRWAYAVVRALLTRTMTASATALTTALIRRLATTTTATMARVSR